MDGSNPCYFTLIRAQGLRLMRPEKAWRPIVTVQVDQLHCHETVMGVDGQNPNLKNCFELREAHSASQVDIHVWYQSQSKKKTRKRILVASTSHTLGELIRLQDNECRKGVELRLNCQSVSKRPVSSRGRPQNGATLLIKIRLPARVNEESLQSKSVEDTWEVASSSTQVSEPPSTPPPPTDNTCALGSKGLTKTRSIRHRRGYMHSDDECSVYDDGDQYATEQPIFSDGDEDGYPDDESDIALSEPHSQPWIHTIWSCLLPQYTERIEVPQDMTFAESVLASFTTYNELRNASTESQFEKVFTRLQTEWSYVGGLLVALAAVNTAVFAIGPDAVFDVESYTRSAIAASSVCTGLGIACDAWFLLRYTWAPLPTFITRALDIYSTYMFFSLSARVPALCLFLSAFALMLFMALVSFEVWPAGVLIMCFGVGAVMALQFLVYGA
ncbi:hypothetical protein C0993_007608, partial [Termitomyces sp. T159_Od127]